MNLVAHLVACLAPMVAEITVPYPFVFYLGAIGIALFISSFLKEIIETDEEDDDMIHGKTFEDEYGKKSQDSYFDKDAEKLTLDTYNDRKDSSDDLLLLE